MFRVLGVYNFDFYFNFFSLGQKKILKQFFCESTRKLEKNTLPDENGDVIGKSQEIWN